MNPHTLFLTKGPKIYDGEKITFSTNVAGKVAIHLQETETTSIFIILYLYQLKIVQGT
jgi:hypothetical protein